MQKSSYIVISIIVLAAIAFGIYFFFFRGVSIPADTQQTGSLPGTPAQSGQQPGTQPDSGTPVGNWTQTSRTFGVVAQNPVIDFYVDNQNNVILVQPDGQIVRVTDGNPSVLSSSAIPNLISASFSYDGKKILAVFGDRLNPQESIFDTGIKAWQPLQPNLRSATWSPNSYEIVYLTGKDGVFSLAKLDTNNPKAKPVSLATLHINDVVLSWLDTNRIIITNRGSALSSGSAWSFDTKAKTMLSLVNDKLGLDALWNSTAGMGLVFGAGTGGWGGELSLVDIATGQTLKALTIVTFPEKCSFYTETVQATSTAPAAPTSSKTVVQPPPKVVNKYLYCAIPRNAALLNANAMPDSYLEKSIFTTDDLYKIDLSGGNTSPVFADTARDLDAITPKVFNKNIFFINRFDQKLYAVSLEQ